MLLEKVRCLLNEIDGFIRSDAHQLGEKIFVPAGSLHRRNSAQPFGAAISPESRREPCLHQILEGQFGGGRVDDLGTRIDAGLDGIRTHELLAKAMNCGAGNFIQGSPAVINILALDRGKGCRQGVLQLGRDLSLLQLACELLDTFQELARRSFRERDGHDIARSDAGCQHDRYAARHERRLAAAGARFDEQRAIMVGERYQARRGIGKNSSPSPPFQGSSHNGARSESSAATKGRMRSK